MGWMARKFDLAGSAFSFYEDTFLLFVVHSSFFFVYIFQLTGRSICVDDAEKHDG